MLLPAGHVIRLRSTADAQETADALLPIKTERKGREITFLEAAEICLPRPKPTLFDNVSRR